ncbi:hypothetical protein ACF09Y_21965 [Streptomyces massasporeus]|uniref:hypothetical protein n=1 Tax=Streptomyces massasporeus TaxID=67324 RepID=UPI003702170B
MTETPTALVLALQKIHGPCDMWPVKIKAAHAQLIHLESLAPHVYAPALQCAVEATYSEAAQPSRWDFLGWQRQRAFERCFGKGPDPAVDVAFLTCRFLVDLLGPEQYRAFVSAAWEASRLQWDRAAAS